MKTSEYWAGHEYVREHARSKTESRCLIRLVEVLATQWNEDYFKNSPFAVRLNGEDFGTFATLEEARECFDNVEKIYND